MRHYTALHGYSDPKQRRLTTEDEELEDFTPRCGNCERLLTWGEDIAEGLCQKCKAETYGRQKAGEW